MKMMVVLSAMSMVACSHQAVQESGASAPAASNRQQAPGPLLSPERIRSTAKQPEMWLAYLERSRGQFVADSTSMASELASLSQTQMTQASYARSFEMSDKMTPQWFVTDEARSIAENLLSFQAPNGGWSKHVSYEKGPRAKGQSYFGESTRWQWISTFDNGSTTTQMHFLAMRDSAVPDPRYKEAYLRGFRYLLAAQFPNGCWPQVWPLDGGYHDAATFNDDVTTNILTTLQEIATGNPSFMSSSDRSLAASAVQRGIECVLDSQLRVNGVATAWGQQHDPLTLVPIGARSYELVSLTAQESANLMRFLIKQPQQSPRLVTAIHAAAAWLKSTAIMGYTYDFATGRHDAPGKGPLWARMYEIGTNRPIFSDRNGVKLYDWNDLKDRRLGYAWYTYSPVLALRQYENWARKNPLPVTSGTPKK
ncbi:MAG TPA: pectate lyase [Gemmatimonadaceae bacterium]|nr:pectate lyase [Gemmatimonadaceae bacterium]